MTKKFKEYKEFAKFVEHAAVVAGFWPQYMNQSEFYHKLLLVNGLVCVLSLLLVLNFCVDNIGHLHVVAENCRIVFTHTNQIIKAGCFYRYRRELMEFQNTIDHMYDKVVDNEKKRDTFLASLGTFTRLAYLLAVTATCVGLMYTLLPLIFILVRYLHGGLAAIRYRLPFAAKYPFEVDDTLETFLCQYIFQCVAFGLMVTGSVASNTLLAYYVFHLTSQLRLLAIKFTDATGRSEFRECVDRLVQLRRCKEILEVAYGPIFIWLFITVAITLCTIVFQAFTMEMSTKVAVIFASYISGKIAESFSLAWYGELVTTESENTVAAIYNSGWYNSSDRKLRSDVLIAAVQRPFVLNIWGFYTVTVDSFTTVLNSTISFFFLLKSLDARKTN